MLHDHGALTGAGRGASEGAFEKVDTGVGAALIIGGQVYRGAVETAGEIGHSTIAEDGPVCRFGNHGSLERFVGALCPADGAATAELVAGELGNRATVAETLHRSRSV